MCLWLCTISVHNTAQNSSDNLPSYLQTTIVAQMLSIGGEGAQYVFVLSQITERIQRRPDLNRNALMFTAVFFLPDSYTLTRRSGRPLHVFYGRVYSILPLSILLTSLLILQGVKSVKFGLDFDTTLLWAAVISKRSDASRSKRPMQRCWSSVLSKFSTVWSTTLLFEE